MVDIIHRLVCAILHIGEQNHHHLADDIFKYIFLNAIFFHFDWNMCLVLGSN